MATAAILLPSVTPPTYHRIVSPTLRLPTDKRTSIPVGLLACQRDPLLRRLTTTVVSAAPAAAAPAPSGKKAKKGNAIITTAPASLLEVVLHDTILFPEGGGQPSDVGLLRVIDGSQTWEVIEVKRRGGTAVHLVKASDNALNVIAPGATFVVALGIAGVKRRMDHMCMHTSQHVLSALLEKRLQLPTLSWSLTVAPAPCYVELPRAPTAEELAAVQDEANRLVFEGRSVHVEVEEFDRAAYEGVATADVGGKDRAVGRGVPEDYTGGVKRVIVIDGVDRNPCCGTHLPSLHNLQLFLLPSTEAVSRPSAGGGAGPTSTARLYFLAGPRLLTHLGATHAHLQAASSTLSCGPPLVPERVLHVVEERRRAEKRVEGLEAELAGLLGRELAARCCGGDGGGGGAPWAHHAHRADDGSRALAFLGAVGAAFQAALGAGSAVPPPYVLVLSSGPTAPSAGGTNVVCVVGSDEALVRRVGDGLKADVGVKGGGKGPRWSGKWTGVWREGKQSAAVEAVLAAVRL